MACNKWESEGLLLTSGELSVKQGESFLAHLADCPACHDEYHSYNEMKERFFTPEMLDYDAPESLDIFPQDTTTTRPQEQIVVTMPFFTIVRTRVAPIFVLLLGIFLGYTFLPVEENTAMSQGAQVNQNSSNINDSTQETNGDSLREFHEGGSTGIRSVDVTD